MNELAWIRGYSMVPMVADRGKGEVKGGGHSSSAAIAVVFVAVSIAGGIDCNAQNAPRAADARNETLHPDMSLKFWISPTNANDGVLAV
jgi:hypothetical protein